jgi:hypothetical protein
LSADRLAPAHLLETSKDRFCHKETFHHNTIRLSADENKNQSRVVEKRAYSAKSQLYIFFYQEKGLLGFILTQNCSEFTRLPTLTKSLTGAIPRLFTESNRRFNTCAAAPQVGPVS